MSTFKIDRNVFSQARALYDAQPTLPMQKQYLFSNVTVFIFRVHENMEHDIALNLHECAF